MADWDSLISLKTKENEVEKPEVKELETVKNMILYLVMFLKMQNNKDLMMQFKMRF